MTVISALASQKVPFFEGLPLLSASPRRIYSQPPRRLKLTEGRRHCPKWISGGNGAAAAAAVAAATLDYYSLCYYVCSGLIRVARQASPINEVGQRSFKSERQRANFQYVESRPR